MVQENKGNEHILACTSQKEIAMSLITMGHVILGKCWVLDALKVILGEICYYILCSLIYIFIHEGFLLYYIQYIVCFNCNE